MDLRVKKTRKSIFDAFIEIRSKKPLEKITVKELADQAMINKATFYLHFNDIYHLSECIENELIKSVVEQVSQSGYELCNPYEITKLFIEVFSKEEKMTKILFADNRMGIFVNKLEKEIKRFIFEKYPEYKNSMEKSIALSVLIQGSFHTYYNNSQFEDKLLKEVLSKLSEHILM